MKELHPLLFVGRAFKNVMQSFFSFIYHKLLTIAQSQAFIRIMQLVFGIAFLLLY
jgi:hypothetical protein